MRVSKFIAIGVAALQSWTPLVFEWKGAVAAAQAIVSHAAEGQTVGASILRQQFSTIKNTAVVDQHADQSTSSDFGAQGGRLNIQEFGMGGDLAAAQQKLADAYAQPDRLNDIARQSRRDMQERGCPTTAFELVRSSPVLRVTPITITLSVDANGSTTRNESLNTSYSGQVNVRYPTIGYTRNFDVLITAAQVGTPGLALRYEATPFTVPNDGTHFTFNHQVNGSAGTPVIADFGKRDDGYSTDTLVYARPGSVITVMADLYRVKRTFSQSPPTGCPADPPSCIVSGLNFCAPPALGVLDVFQRSKSAKNAAIGTMFAAASAVEYTETDVNIATVVNRGAQVFNGTDPIFTELFTGCTETANYTTNTISVHQPAIRTCSMPLVDLPLTCNGSRGVHFVYLQESTVLTASFFRKVKVAITDPITGLPAKDAQGNIIYTVQDQPAVYSGPVDINVQTFGGVRSWESTPDADGYYAKYDLTPFSVSASEYFPYGVTALSSGSVSISISSLGNKSNNWTLSGSASVSGATQMRLNAKLYQVVNNTILGCDSYLQHAADGFCTAQMTCTESRGPCTTLDGVSFCDGSGEASGVADLLKPWGISDSAAAGGNTGNGTIGGGAKEFLPKMCWSAVGTKMNCNSAYTGEQNCYTDADGNQQCGTATGGGLAANFNEGPAYLDDCATPSKNLVNNSQCRLVSTNTCTDGAAGLFSGTCYNKTVVYDCGTERQVTVPGGVSYAQSCGSPIRCMGTECHNPKGEVNLDFGRAVASANVVDMAARDLVCAETGQRPTNVGDTCTPVIFAGENKTCKIPIGNQVGITPNCCKESDDAAENAPDALNYVKLVYYTYKMASDKAMMQALARVPGLNGFSQTMYNGAGEVQTAIDGAISATKNFMMDSTSTIAKTFGYDLAEATATNVAKDIALDNAVDAGVNAGLSQAQLASYNNFLTNAGMEDFASQLITKTGEGEAAKYALTETGEQAAKMLQGLQTAFMVYSIMKIIGHIVFKCERSELELGTQKKQGNCTYVGNYCAKRSKLVGCIESRESYCCYKTPLARIVAEQIRTKAPEVAGSYGDARNPSCGGFTPTQLAAFDWTKFDPSEWLALLQDAGMIPESTTTADSMWGLNSSRAALATGSPAAQGEVNIQTQTLQRYTPLVETYSQRRENLSRQPVCFADATQMPWYSPTPAAANFFELDQDLGNEVPVWSTRTFDIEIDIDGIPKSFSLTAYRVDNYGQLWVNGNKVFENTIYANSDMRNGTISGSQFVDRNGAVLGDFYDDGCNAGCQGLSPNVNITGYLTKGRNTLTLVCANANEIGPCAIKVMGTSEEPPLATTGCIYPNGAED